MATNDAPRSVRPTCRFVDKVAIVTGSSSGLGKEVALRLAREGACVTLTGRDEKRLADAKVLCQVEAQAAKEGSAGAIKESGSETFATVAGDLTKPDVRKRVVDETIKTFGRLDILVCNAGVFTSQNGLAETTEEQFDLVGGPCSVVFVDLKLFLSALIIIITTTTVTTTIIIKKRNNNNYPVVAMSFIFKI